MPDAVWGVEGHYENQRGYDRVRRLLVFDRDKKLVGLLSLDDLAAKMSSDRLLGTVVRGVIAA
jgi:CBS domain-containing protein